MRENNLYGDALRPLTDYFLFFKFPENPTVRISGSDFLWLQTCHIIHIYSRSSFDRLVLMDPGVKDGNGKRVV